MTVQKKILDLTGSQYLVQKVKSAINDVDSSLSTHIADTDIHVTTADKNKWNNQTYVFRYSSTALVASSTNSNTLLDNTDNLKVGDKVIDSSGVLFSITAIDTANSTFTIGTALIDLAQDSDVVHKSGDETVDGKKTFLDVPIAFKSSTAELGVTGGNTKVIFTDKNLLNLAGITFGNYGSSKLSYCRFHIYDKDSNNQEVENFVEFSYVNNNQVAYFRPNKSNFATLGTVSNRWFKVYANEYYYGSNNVEFSTKFVTTDTNQTISGDKVWTGTNTFQQNVTYQRTNFYHQVTNPTYILKDTELEKGSLATTHASYPGLWHDKNGNVLGYVRFVEYSSGRQTAEFKVSNLIKNGALDPTGSEVNCAVDLELQPSGERSLIPEQNDINLGTSTNKWKTLNGVEPSSLSLPSGNVSDFIDISSYFSNTGSGGENSYTASANGWIFLRLGDISGCQAGIYDANNNRMWGQSATGSVEQLTIPILKGQTLITQWNTSSTVHVAYAKFIPCQGNV